MSSLIPVHWPINTAVFFALLKPGDKIMWMDLTPGGHLTYGSSVALSGKWFYVISYGVRDDNHLIDYGGYSGTIQWNSRVVKDICPK
ncbi:hypothetical protein P4U62_12515 [Bacillus salipaludis]|nr:hypothetical protein [Bacillus salipaludis]